MGPSRDAAGDWLPPARPEQLRGQVEENLRQLGRDTLDLVYLRVQNRDRLTDGLAALAELREQGLIRHLGVSGVTLEQLDEALQVTTLAAVQNRFGVEARRPGDEQIHRSCLEQGLAFVPFFAVAGQGGERGLDESHQRDVVAIAEHHGVSPATVRLAWTLELSPNVLAIPGTGNPAHVDENVAAASLRLSAAEMQTLAAVDAH